MTDQQLGRLERVELRDIWISEATSFTPWLARPENITILSETLNIDLELEAQEKAVFGVAGAMVARGAALTGGALWPCRHLCKLVSEF